MTVAERKSVQKKKNIDGDKMNKIIQEYNSIQKNLKDLSKAVEPDECSPRAKKDPITLKRLSQQISRGRNSQPKKQKRQSDNDEARKTI